MSQPTTGQVRLDYMHAYPSTPEGREIAAAEFDRWLAEHDRQVAEGAWDAGHRCAIGYVAVPSAVPEGGYKNPYRAAKGEQK